MTGAWSGGRPYKEWLAQARPAHPGRLNETCQIVFKDAAESWRRARGGLSSLLWTPMFREGIDGEALEWASERLVRIDAPRRHLILISDGSPMDGATALTNDEGYLDRHLAEIAADIEARGALSLSGIGIGHDMSAYLARSRVIDPDRILDRDTARAILEFLADG
jgi:cobaltochelatase CobT